MTSPFVPPFPALRHWVLRAVVVCTLLAPSADACITLVPSALPNVPINPMGIETADLDADGSIDLIVTSGNASTVLVYLGNGDGTFAAPVTHPVAGRPLDVAVADLNADGDPDLFTANINGNTVAILLGNGDGTFLPPVLYASGGTWPVAVVAADFDGDSDADIAVSNNLSGNVALLANNGDGTFAAAATIATGSTSGELTSGHFNGDTDPDLAIPNGGPGTVTILLGGPGSTFIAAPTITSGAYSTSVITRDFDADGNADLAVSNNNDSTVTVHAGNGDGTFAAPAVLTASGAAFVTAGDLDADGDFDLVSGVGSGGINVFSGEGDGTFTGPLIYPGGTDTFRVTVGDFNSDGRDDAAASHQLTDAVSLYLSSNAPGALSLSSAAYSSGEADGFVTITVTRTGGTDCSVTIDYATSNGSATAGSDYTATSGTLTFAPGVTTQSFNVPILNDPLDEPDETFVITLTNPAGGATGGAQSTSGVTIADDDAPIEPIPSASTWMLGLLAVLMAVVGLKRA